MKITKPTLSPAQQAELENAMARAVRNEANIDYIAMMADVEISTEEEGETDETDESEI